MNNIKIILFLSVFCVFSSCTKDGYSIFSRKIDLQIDPRLPKDENGFYYFKLYSMTKQNIHRISGSLRLNGRIPGNSATTTDIYSFGDPNDIPLTVTWKNNLFWYWLLNPTDAPPMITKTYFNESTGQWSEPQSLSLPSYEWELVPTINKSCYNDRNGEINIMIGPIWAMRGDTMIVTAKCEDVLKFVKIILK